MSHGDKPDFPVRHMEAVCRDGDFSIKGGNLGVGKKISINILKIKSVEVFLSHVIMQQFVSTYFF